MVRRAGARMDPERVGKAPTGAATWEKVKVHKARGHATGYSDDFDAVYCATCREWLEARCRDPLCEYCRGRPEQAPGVVLPDDTLSEDS